ncbi:hypothetical protein [Geminicoccus flavidas]|uniref:hypothetical protein n=1 Tax=Geminicoccus flavidas TaxID=2506407 RepID=UPI00135AB099|nr:hypothetical protein [Geminicoccus flavidas]
MFPYRRNVKKRGKNGPQQRKGAQHGGQGQRIPGSARDVLRLLQPATKALAQLLAGNTRPSGQLNHARHVLDQAQRLVDERQVERLGPQEREEFLEQLARLKLTLADVRDLEEEQDGAGPADPRPTKPAVAPERLREMALALASPGSMASAPPAPLPVETAVAEEPEAAAEPALPEPEAGAEPEEEARPGPRGQRLRLRRTTPLAASIG